MDDLKNGQEIGQDTAPETGKDSTGTTDGWNAEENKPYMRQLGKKFWGNETLRGFDSLNDVIDDYMKLKTVPEKYDIEGAEEYSDTFKRIGLNGDAAKEVMSLISKAKPEKVDADAVLREMHGDKVATMRTSAEKAMKSFADESTVKLAEKYGLMGNPAFIAFASAVGNEVGENFHDFRGNGGDKGSGGRSAIMNIAKRSLGIKE